MFVKTGLVLMALASIALSLPVQETQQQDATYLDYYTPLKEELYYEPQYLVRVRRDIEFNPHVNKQDGTTNAGASVTHKGDNHEVTGHWNKNIRGPRRSKPNYGVRGSFKW